MKPLLILTAVTASTLLSSCVVEPGAYGSTGYSPGYYDSGYYGGGGGGYYGGGGGSYYGGGYNGGSNYHGGTVSRPYGKPWSSSDDARLDAAHRTSPHYTDPHNGGVSHAHDSEGHRVDSQGHHVDAEGNHTSVPDENHADHNDNAPAPQPHHRPVIIN